MRPVSETYLDRIVAAHRAAADRDTRRLEDLMAEATAGPDQRGFGAAIRRDVGISVISEVKRRSPSKGDLSPDLDPAALAETYEVGGATCLSVLTDEEWFGGSVDDLQKARAAVSLPVLRKDFTVDVRDVADTRIMGADCVLLIAAVLDDSELREFHELALELGLDALVEIHDEADLERAMAVEASLVGVNQRDLVTFEVDQARAVSLAPRIPAGVVRVAESGIRDRADAVALAEAGYDALLVGESLVTSGDPAVAIRELRGR